VRIAARDLEPSVRNHARRICLGKPSGDPGAEQPGAIKLKAVRIE
jgi:hypothetical protein